MIEHTGFENGGRVPTSDTCNGPDELLADKLPAELREIVDREVAAEVASAVWEATSRFAVEISQHKNPQLTVTAFCFAAGLYVLEGKSVTQLAGELGVSKQALSKRIVLITERLGLPPSRGMKSEAARESYRKAHTQPKVTRSKLP